MRHCDKTLADIAHELREMDPSVLPNIERIALASGREVLAVTVERGARRPYSFRGEAYRRVGTTNRQLSRQEYGQILLEQLRLLPDFPQCLLRIARFKGADKTEFLDNRQFHSNAFDRHYRE